MIAFEVAILNYKESQMTNALCADIRREFPEALIRIWDSSPEPSIFPLATETRWNRFNPSISRSWNWAIGQSLSEWTLISNEDIHLRDGWRAALEREVLDNATSLWHGPSRCFLFNRNLLDRVGWFDENFLGNTWEDLDYVRRMNHARVPKVYGRSSCLWTFAEDLKPSHGRQLNPGSNVDYFKTKYNNLDSENFDCAPNFPTPDFYPQRAR